MADQAPISVLFCCMGNICRSTMAEGVFQAMAKQPPYRGRVAHIDSCGTIGYHAGDEPDDRTMATLASHGITDYHHRARQVTLADFDRFDYIFAMDRQNLNDLERLQRKKPGSRARVLLFGTYARPQPQPNDPEIVQDPYYGGREGFAKAYEQTTRFSRNFLNSLFPGAEQGGGAGDSGSS